MRNALFLFAWTKDVISMVTSAGRGCITRRARDLDTSLKRSNLFQIWPISDTTLRSALMAQLVWYHTEVEVG
jgi:hypothetical protein